MSSNALDTEGVLIKRGDGATPTEVFNTIGEITGFSGPGGSAAVKDVSDLQSVAKEKRPGLQDWGQMTLDMSFLPLDAEHKGLLADKSNRTLRNFEFHFTDGATTPTKWSFSAFVLGLSITGAIDDVIKGSITLEISGDVVQTDGS